MLESNASRSGAEESSRCADQDYELRTTMEATNGTWKDGRPRQRRARTFRIITQKLEEIVKERVCWIAALMGNGQDFEVEVERRPRASISDGRSERLPTHRLCSEPPPQTSGGSPLHIYAASCPMHGQRKGPRINKRPAAGANGTASQPLRTTPSGTSTAHGDRGGGLGEAPLAAWPVAASTPGCPSSRPGGSPVRCRDCRLRPGP